MATKKKTTLAKTPCNCVETHKHLVEGNTNTFMRLLNLENHVHDMNRMANFIFIAILVLQFIMFKRLFAVENVVFPLTGKA